MLGSSTSARTSMAASAAAVSIAAVTLIIPAARTAIEQALSLLTTGQLARLVQFLQSLGGWAPFASIGVLAAQALVIPLPAAIIMVANGLAFGLWRGTLVSMAGTCIGAVAAYAIGRGIGRMVLERVVPRTNVLWADQFMRDYGRWAIVFTRWAPGVPLDPISYVAGLTRVPAVSFVGLTILGMLPATFVTAYLGSNIDRNMPSDYWIPGLLIVATLWLVWRTIRRNKRSMRLT